MARPTKNNADYFSHDADMRNHRKMKAIRAKFGLEGYAVWNMLLEVLTDAEHFKIEIDEVEVELLAGDFGIESEMLNEMINYFTRLKLLQDEGGMLVCNSLIDRMQPLLDKRERQKKYAKSKKGSENSKKQVNDVENSVNDVENPQSKVKYSKVKESKVKHSKGFFNETKKIEKTPIEIENEMRQYYNENTSAKHELFFVVEKSCGKTLTMDEKKAIAARITVFANDYALRPNWDSQEPLEKKTIRFTNYIINSIKNGYQLTNNNNKQQYTTEKKGYRVSAEFEKLLDEMAATPKFGESITDRTNNPFASNNSQKMAGFIN